MHLGPDALCGRSQRPDAAAPAGNGTGRLPACVHDGACVKSGEVLPVSRLRTPVLVLNGCNLMRIGGPGAFGPEFTLPFAFLEGRGVAAVASRRTRFGDDAEVLLADRLLRTGHSLGETVRVLNAALPHWGREAPDHLLLGDPEHRPVTGPPPAAAAVRPDGDGVELGWRDVDAVLLEARLPVLPDRPEIRVVGSAPELFAAVVPEPGGGWRLLAFSWARIRQPELTLRVVPGTGQDERRGELAAAGGALAAYRRLLRGLVPGLDHAERELDGRATALARAWAHARSRPAVWADADRAGAEVTELLDRLDAELAAALLDRVDRGAYVWLDQYAEVEATIQPVRHRAGPPCPYCGAPTAARDYRHLWRPGADRDFAICATCGNVWDTDAGLAPVVLDGPADADRPGELRQVLVVDNPGHQLLRGHVGVRLYQGGPRGSSAEPAIVQVGVPPRSQARVEVTVRVGERQPAHIEFLRGFLVSRLRVGVSSSAPCGSGRRRDRAPGRRDRTGGAVRGPLIPRDLTGDLHLGHALTAAVQDALVRSAALDGRPVAFVPGVDHAGTGMYSVVLRATGFEPELPLADRLERWAARHRERIREQFRLLGLACDWDRETYTLEPRYRELVADTFRRLAGAGLLSRERRVVPWCPGCRTTVPDVEREQRLGPRPVALLPLRLGRRPAILELPAAEDVWGAVAVLAPAGGGTVELPGVSPGRCRCCRPACRRRGCWCRPRTRSPGAGPRRPGCRPRRCSTRPAARWCRLPGLDRAELRAATVQRLGLRPVRRRSRCRSAAGATPSCRRCRAGSGTSGWLR